MDESLERSYRRHLIIRRAPGRPVRPPLLPLLGVKRPSDRYAALDDRFGILRNSSGSIEGMEDMVKRPVFARTPRRHDRGTS